MKLVLNRKFLRFRKKTLENKTATKGVVSGRSHSSEHRSDLEIISIDAAELFAERLHRDWDRYPSNLDKLN
jgi:hypothetical protein